jgi:hypothetical protein
MDNSHVETISQVVMELLDRDEKIILDAPGEFILGRLSEESTQGGSKNLGGRVDIDLSAYQAYEMGVSRRHASLSIGRALVTITDLRSTNGTRKNGEIIPAYTPEELFSGDILTLGRMKVKLIISTVSNRTPEVGGTV